VSFLNFKSSKTSSLYKKIAYPVISNYLYKRAVSLFFINIFSYFINIFKNTAMFVFSNKNYPNKIGLTLKYKKYLKKKNLYNSFYEETLVKSNNLINITTDTTNRLLKTSKI
jgi:hypothetical protein